jgi:hypothetical protein
VLLVARAASGSPASSAAQVPGCLQPPLPMSALAAFSRHRLHRVCIPVKHHPKPKVLGRQRSLRPAPGRARQRLGGCFGSGTHMIWAAVPPQGLEGAWRVSAVSEGAVEPLCGGEKITVCLHGMWSEYTAVHLDRPSVKREATSLMQHHQRSARCSEYLVNLMKKGCRDRGVCRLLQVRSNTTGRRAYVIPTRAQPASRNVSR